MQSSSEANRKYFHEEVGERAFIFLANLHRFNLDARRLMANATFKGVYKPLEERQGDLANLDDASRRSLMDLTMLDMLAKTFMALEDLGKILLTTGKPLKEIPATILGAGQDDSLNAIAKYASRPEGSLYKIFPFLHRGVYGLTGEDAKAVEAYWTQSVRTAKRILTFAADFIKRHAWAYNKYKHGMPMIVGLGDKPLAPGINGTVPIFTTLAEIDKPKFILSGDLVADKLIGFTESAVGLSKALVERRLQLAEFGGTPPPLLCHIVDTPNGARCEAWGFGEPFDEATKKTFTEVFNRIMPQMFRTKGEARLNRQSDPAKIQDWINFYTRDWKVT